MFAEELKRLRVDQKLPQRLVAASLDVDTATYCKIEKGERKARKEHISILSKVLKVNKDKLMTLWLADKISSIAIEEKKFAAEALEIANQNLVSVKNNGTKK